MTIVQLVPSHCSIKVRVVAPEEELPTAKQSDSVQHETPSSVELIASLGFGLVTTDQLVPSQTSVSVPVSTVAPTAPTATQLVALTHETACNVAAPGSVVPTGLVPVVQVVPSQCSITSLAPCTW